MDYWRRLSPSCGGVLPCSHATIAPTIALTSFPFSGMTDATGKYFGLVIAYVLPGFAALWSLQPYSATVRSWLQTSATLPAGLESVFFVTLASTAAGMSISALRWAVIDTLIRLTGVTRPSWDDARLQENVHAWDVIVEAHYRFFQFYAHTAIVLPFILASSPIGRVPIAWVLCIAIDLLFLAAARDALAKYYARAIRLLGTLPSEKLEPHDERQSQTPPRERHR